MDGPDGPWRGNAHHPEVNWISALSEPTLLPPYFAGSNTSNLIKRLEEGQFIWPAVRGGKVSITRSQLAMLLDKLDWRQPKTSRLNALTML